MSACKAELNTPIDYIFGHSSRHASLEGRMLIKGGPYLCAALGYRFAESRDRRRGAFAACGQGHPRGERVITKKNSNHRVVLSARLMNIPPSANQLPSNVAISN